MGVAFTKSGVGYAHKGGALAEVCKVTSTHITHSGFQAARKLVQHASHRSFIGNLPFDALRNQFEGVADLGLEVAIGRAARHRADRAHATVSLEGAALVQID